MVHSPQIVAVVESGPGWTQSPGIAAGSLTWVTGAQALGPSSPRCFNREVHGKGSTWDSLIQDAGVAGGRLTSITTALASLLHFSVIVTCKYFGK